MLGRCPCCGTSASLELFIGNDIAAKAVIRALSITAVGRLVIKYLGLFRPQQKTLSMDRVAKILDDLLPMIEQGEIKRNGISHKVNHAAWEAALTKVLEMRDLGKLQLPFKNHAYLLEVVITEIGKVASPSHALDSSMAKVAPTVLDEVLSAQDTESLAEIQANKQAELAKQAERERAEEKRKTDEHYQRVRALMTPEERARADAMAARMQAKQRREGVLSAAELLKEYQQTVVETVKPPTVEAVKQDDVGDTEWTEEELAYFERYRIREQQFNEARR